MTPAMRIHRRCSRSNRRRAGLSLLETILAIAILGGALAVIGESMRVGTMAAADARDMTMAQLLCESKLAELTAGLQQLTSTASTPVEVAPDWQYMVQVERSSQQGLMIIAVTVAHDPLQSARPASVTLYRWIIDPELTAQIQAAADALEEQNQSSSSSSTSGASGGNGSGTGGTGGSNNGGN